MVTSLVVSSPALLYGNENCQQKDTHWKEITTMDARGMPHAC